MAISAGSMERKKQQSCGDMEVPKCNLGTRETVLGEHLKLAISCNWPIVLNDAPSKQMYTVKISFLKTYCWYQLGILLFFGIFCSFAGVEFQTRAEAVFFVCFMGFVSLIGALLATFMIPAMASSKLTSDGILATFGAMGTENLIRWDEINSITNNWLSPCYVVRNKTKLWTPSIEELRQRVGTLTPQRLRIAALPKPFFLKDKQAFLAYLDQVLPQENKLRSYYF